MITLGDAKKTLRKIARDNGAVFKDMNVYVNGKSAWAMIKDTGERVSSLQSLRNWRDDIVNGDIYAERLSEEFLATERGDISRSTEF